MKKKFAVFCVILCLASCFVFPASAASTTPISSIYYPMVYNSVGDVQIMYADGENVFAYISEVQVENTDFRVKYSHDIDSSNFIDNDVGVLCFSIALDERLLDYSSDEYSLHVSWRTGLQDDSDIDEYFLDYYDMFADSNDPLYTVFGLTESSTYKPSKYSDYSYSWNFDQTELYFYNSYTFTGAAMDAALASDMSFALPNIPSGDGYVDLEIFITTLDGTPVEFPPPKPTLGTGIVTSLVNTIGAFLAGVGGNIVAVFNAIVVTETGTLSSFAIWSLVFLGVGLAGGVIAAILRKIG